MGNGESSWWRGEWTQGDPHFIVPAGSAHTVTLRGLGRKSASSSSVGQLLRDCFWVNIG